MGKNKRLHVLDLFIKTVLLWPLLLACICIRLSKSAPSLNFSYASYTSDTYIDNQWAIEKIELNKLWKIITGTNSVKVGIIDSGIDGNHEDLDSNINSSLSECFSSATNPLTDLNGHGTHVAGIIGAEGNNNQGISGICWDVDLISLNISDQYDYVDQDALADAVEYATLNSIPIINMSISGGIYDSDLEDAIDDYPGLLVCCAGNEGLNLGNNVYHYLSYPSCFLSSNIISVGNSTIDDEIGTNSNYGSLAVDLFAPGTSIYSTIPNSDYISKSGTSMAAPMVAGVAALLLSINPNLSTNQLKSAILDGVDTFSSFSGKCVSGGRLNAYKAALNVIPSIIHSNNGSSFSLDTTFARFLKTECNSAHYCLTFNGPSHYRVSLLTTDSQTPLVSAEFNDSYSHSISFALKKTQTIFVKFENLSTSSGTINVNISEPTAHDYTDSYISYNSLFHKSICICGAYILQQHVYMGGGTSCVMCSVPPPVFDNIDNDDHSINVLSIE